MTDPVSELPFTYQIYGLRVSSMSALPGLRPAEHNGPVDVSIYLDHRLPVTASPDDVPWYTNPDADAHGNTLLRVWRLDDGRYYRFLYGDGAEFIVNRTGSTIWADWPDILTLEEIIGYIYGPIMGFILRLRGTIALHASAVIIEDQAIAITGQSGRGKSTTAAALAKRGYPCVTDDVVTLYERDEAFHVYPGYPRVKLWPHSVRMLYGSEEALPRVISTTQYWQHWDKRYLNLLQEGFQFPDKPHPLAAIYILAERSSDPSTPFIQDRPSGHTLRELISNTFTNYISNRAMRATEFNLMGTLLDQVHIRHLQPQSDPDRLDDLCDQLLKDAQSVIRTG